MLLQRLVSALIAVALILVVLFVLPLSFVPPVGLIVVGASAWEWSALARFEKAGGRAVYTATVLALCGTYFFFRSPSLFQGLIIVASAWWLLSLVMVLRYPIKVARSVVVLGGPVALVSLFAVLDGLVRFGSGQTLLGPVMLVFTLLVVCAADVGGYFVGRRVGGAKLAPKVSPNKTWAGVFGGLALSALIGALGSVMWDFPWYLLVPMCVFTAAVSVVGDLTISLFKREAGLKDSGNLFPGHGGILDRVDSISAGATLFVAGLMLGHGPW